MKLDPVKVPGWKQVRALRARLKTRRGKVVLALLLTLGAMAAALFAPLEGLTQSGRWTLAIFAMAAVFWMTEVVPLFVTSLIILALELVVLVPTLAADGLDTGEAAFMAPFFSNVTLLFLGGLLLAQAATRHRLDTWFAARLLRLSGGKPSRVLLSMMIASAALSMWMSNTATTAMMLILVVVLVRQLPTEGSEFRKALFLGVPFACNIGGLGTPIGTPPNAIAVTLLESRGQTVGFVSWMVSAIPLVVILLGLLWWMLLKAYPAPDKDFVLPDSDAKAGDGGGGAGGGFSTRFPSGWRPRLTLCIFLLSVVLWLTGGLTGLASGQVALIAAVLLLGLNLLDAKDFKGISWDVLFLVGGGLALGVAVEVSGLALWLGEVMRLGELDDLLLLAVFVLAGLTLTTFMSNTATANMLMPLALTLPLDAQVGPASLLVAIAMATSSSMMLPVSTPPNAIAYYSGEVEIRDMLKHGVVITFVAAGLTWLAALTLWHWMGLGGG